VADEFRKSVVAAGGKVVGREFTTDKATDFNAILTKLKGANPDLVFFGGMDAVAGPMLRQLKQLGMNVKYMGGDGICSPKLSELAGNSISDGQVYCAEAGGVTPDKEAGMKAWRDAFKKKFGGEVQIYAPYVYDATMTMVDAMVKADSADPKKYLPVLAKISHDGVTGPISFDSKGDIKGGSLTLYTYKGGNKTQLAVVK
jgi:branched-chain amino acid transport system substrate-binding protein